MVGRLLWDATMRGFMFFLSRENPGTRMPALREMGDLKKIWICESCGHPMGNIPIIVLQDVDHEETRRIVIWDTIEITLMQEEELASVSGLKS
jgi:hypothetical protein